MESLKYVIKRYKREKVYFWKIGILGKLHFVSESMCLFMFAKLKDERYGRFDRFCTKFLWSPLEAKLRKYC